MTCKEALRIIDNHRGELAKYKVKSLAIFGSVVRNETRSDSDIDLLVEFSEPVGMFKFLDLQEYLENILKVKVDLATVSALKRQLRAKILEEAVRAA